MKVEQRESGLIHHLPTPIVLIGFMGCGKSCVAKELAALLKYEATDVDSLIVNAAKKSIPEIFTENGEAEFRRIETEQLRVVLEESSPSRVIATGGGIVTREENRALLQAAKTRQQTTPEHSQLTSVFANAFSNITHKNNHQLLQVSELYKAIGVHESLKLEHSQLTSIFASAFSSVTRENNHQLLQAGKMLRAVGMRDKATPEYSQLTSIFASAFSSVTRENNHQLLQAVAAHNGILQVLKQLLEQIFEPVVEPAIRQAVGQAVEAHGPLIVHLHASSEVLAQRIRQQPGQRPLIDGGKILNLKQTHERVAELLEERAPLYGSVANLTIESDTLTPGEVAEQIIDKIIPQQTTATN